MSEGFIPCYDLESLNEEQRQNYIKAVCAHMGVPDNLNLVALTRIDDGEGPSRLVAYAKRGATENVRNNLQIDVTSLTSTMVNGSIVFTATAVSKKTGRQEISTGAKYIDGLTGTPLDDALMTAQTRALRRVTLQFVGAGVLDESEVHQGRTVKIIASPASTISIAPPQPTVAPTAAPGKDTTMVISTTIDHVENTIAHEKPLIIPDQDKLRADAIAQLNGHAQEKKPRKPRVVKKKIDMGPSVPPPAMPAPSVQVPTDQPSAANVEAVLRAQVPVPVPPAVPSKPRLTPEQVKPYRQRLFKIVNDHLEPNGFTPKEGIGNAEKMRSLAGIMFSDVGNLAELTTAQWETYLTTLENKINMLGTKATIEYIEDAIGL